MKTAKIILIFIFLFLVKSAFCDTGILIPINIKDEPDPNILSLYNMEVNISIDNQFASVQVLQIFENHTGRDIEGQYLFVIPEKSAISDFAVWDNGIRIPGVILERRRVRELYEEITRVRIDPGLLEQVSEEIINVFSTKVFPIPAYGTKRIELTYTQELDVTDCRSYFCFPLKPTKYQIQNASNFKITFSIKTQFPMKDFTIHSKDIKPTFTLNTPNQIKGNFAAKDFALKEDFSFEYLLDIQDFFLNFLTYRKVDLSDEPVPLFTDLKHRDEEGYFQAQAIFNIKKKVVSENLSPRTIFLLLDTSLSMRWDKLDRAYEAIEHFLRNLPPKDKFQLILFNDEINSLPILPVTAQNVENALEFIRRNYLLSGTDIKKALSEAITLANKTPGQRYIVVITDGHPTLGEVSYKLLNNHLIKINQERVPLFIFGIGNDTNVPLLEELVKPNDGYFVWVNETEDLGFKLRTFLSKIGEGMIKGIGFIFESLKNIRDVYPKDSFKAFDGSLVSIVGRYAKPTKTSIKINGEYRGKAFSYLKKVILPEKSLFHPHL
ncbi:MAG: VIT and VWA domain-containing protein, partial [bacterium]